MVPRVKQRVVGAAPVGHLERRDAHPRAVVIRTLAALGGARTRPSRPPAGRRARSVRQLASAVVLAGAVSCHRSEHGAAAVGLGTAVLLTGVHRARTGDCWATCGAGTVCNRERGLCERGECVPACPVGRHCIRDLDGQLYCRAHPAVFSLGGGAATASGSSFSVGGAGAAAPVGVEAGVGESRATGAPYAPWNDAANGGAAARDPASRPP